MAQDVRQKFIITTDAGELKEVITSLFDIEAGGKAAGAAMAAGGARAAKGLGIAAGAGKLLSGVIKSIGLGTIAAAAALGGLVGIVAGLVGVLAKATRMAASFEQKFVEVTTLFDTASVNAQKLSADLIDLSATGPLALLDLTRGLYDLISAGIDAEDAVSVLDVAMKAAIGGATDADTAIDGLTSAMNAWSIAAEDAESVADSFFVAVRNGKTTFDQLSNSIGRLGPIAAATGVSLDESLSAVAAMTTAGVRTNIAMTQLRSLLVAVARQVPQTQQVARELGVDFSVASLRAKGLEKFLQDVIVAAKGNENQITRLVGRIEALNAIVQLTGSQSDKFAKNLNDMADKAGAAEAAFRKMEGTVINLVKTISNKFAAVMTRLGNEILPTVASVLEALAEKMDQFILDPRQRFINLLEDLGVPEEQIIPFKLDLAFDTAEEQLQEAKDQIASAGPIVLNFAVEDVTSVIPSISGGAPSAITRPEITGPEIPLKDFTNVKDLNDALDALGQQAIKTEQKIQDMFVGDQDTIDRLTTSLNNQVAIYTRRLRTQIASSEQLDIAQKQVDTLNEQLLKLAEGTLDFSDLLPEDQVAKAEALGAEVAREYAEAIQNLPEPGTDDLSDFLLAAAGDKAKQDFESLNVIFAGNQEALNAVARASLKMLENNNAAANGAERFAEKLKEFKRTAQEAAESLRELEQAAIIDAQPDFAQDAAEQIVDLSNQAKEFASQIEQIEQLIAAKVGTDQDATEEIALLKSLREQFSDTLDLALLLEDGLEDSKKLDEIIRDFLAGSDEIDVTGIDFDTTEVADEMMEAILDGAVDDVRKRLKEKEIELTLPLAEDKVLSEADQEAIKQGLDEFAEELRQRLLAIRAALILTGAPPEIFTGLNDQILELTLLLEENAKSVEDYISAWEGVANIANALADVSQEIAGLSEEFEIAVRGLATFTSSIAAAKNDLEDFKKARADVKAGVEGASAVGAGLTAAAGVVGAIGAVVGVFSSLAEAQKRRQRERTRQIKEMIALRKSIRDNTRAIQEGLQTNFEGGVIGGDLDQSQIGRARALSAAADIQANLINIGQQAFEQLLSKLPDIGNLREEARERFTAQTAEGLRPFLEEIEASGIAGMEGLVELFDSVLEQTGSVQQAADAVFAEIDGAVRMLGDEIGMVTQDMAGALVALDRATSLLGKEGDEAVQVFLDFLEGLDVQGEAGDIIGQLSGLDFNTEEGRQAAIGIVEAITQMISSGEAAEAGLFNTFSPEEWRQLLDTVLEFAENPVVEEGGFSSSVAIQRTITEIQGNEVIILLNEISFHTRRLKEITESASGVPPQSMMQAGQAASNSGLGIGSTGVVGGITNNFDIDIDVSFPVQRILRELDKEVRAELYEAFPQR